MPAGAQEVGVQRVQRALLDGAVRGDDLLRGDKAAEEAPLALARVAEEEVAVELLKLKLRDEAVDLGLAGSRHAGEV